MKRKTWFAAALAGLLFLGLAAFLVADAYQRSRNVQTADFAMNTPITMKITGRKAQDCAADVPSDIRTLELRQLSRYMETADVCRVNAEAGRAVDVKVGTARLAALALEIREKSGNAFDPTLGLLRDLWDVTAENPRVPSQAEIDRLFQQERLLTVRENTLQVSQEGILDFGAIGKGAACDAAFDRLSAANAKSAVVSVGGSVLTFGGAKDFTVGIRDPKGTAADTLGILTVGAAVVSTSGGYEQFFLQAGLRYHHILDGRSGSPANAGLACVSVLLPKTAQNDNGALSDILSTACFVLGYADAEALLAEYHADAVFVQEDGGIRTVNHSGVPLQFALTSERYRVLP